MRVLLTLWALGIVAAGCGSADDDALTRADTVGAAGNGNFTLYVSNQSFEHPAIDIRVHIDGKLVVADEFEVEDQHTWVAFRLALRTGTHVIRAEASDAELRRTFRVKGKRWAVLDYWCCDDAEDPRFTFDVSKRPIAFA